MPPPYPYLNERSRSMSWVIQLRFSIVLGRKRFRDEGYQRDHLTYGRRFGGSGRILDCVAFCGENGEFQGYTVFSGRISEMEIPA